MGRKTPRHLLAGVFFVRICRLYAFHDDDCNNDPYTDDKSSPFAHAYADTHKDSDANGSTLSNHNTNSN